MTACAEEYYSSPNSTCQRVRLMRREIQLMLLSPGKHSWSVMAHLPGSWEWTARPERHASQAKLQPSRDRRWESRTRHRSTFPKEVYALSSQHRASHRLEGSASELLRVQWVVRRQRRPRRSSRDTGHWCVGTLLRSPGFEPTSRSLDLCQDVMQHMILSGDIIFAR